MSRPLLVTAGGIGVALLALALTVLDSLVEDGAIGLPDFALDFLDRLILIGAAVGASVLVLRLSRLQSRTADLALGLERASRDGRDWRAQSRRFIHGLGQAIETQFEAWALTPAEADVASLLLKGATLREIATMRHTSEATIRQQAQCVYRKSGLASRAELSAYFLEDLFSFSEAAATPRDDAEEAPMDGIAPGAFGAAGGVHGRTSEIRRASIKR